MWYDTCGLKIQVPRRIVSGLIPPTFFGGKRLSV